MVVALVHETALQQHIKISCLFVVKKQFFCPLGTCAWQCCDDAIYFMIDQLSKRERLT